jgi:hypothetical protein
LTLSRSVMSQRLPALGADRGGHLFGGVEVQVEHRHARAFGAEALARRAADAAAAAGDDHSLVVESLHEESFPSTVRVALLSFASTDQLRQCIDVY